MFFEICLHIKFLFRKASNICKKYNLYFLHDLHEDLDLEFDDITLKYKRKIEKFMDASQKGVCFIRAIKNLEELQWIIKNQEYINNCSKIWNT